MAPPTAAAAAAEAPAQEQRRVRIPGTGVFPGDTILNRSIFTAFETFTLFVPIGSCIRSYSERSNASVFIIVFVSGFGGTKRR